MQFLATLLLAAAVSALPAITYAQTIHPLASDHCTGGCSNASGPQDSFGSVAVSDLGGGLLSFSLGLLNNNSFVKTGFPLTFSFDLAGDPVITYLSVTAGSFIRNELPVNQQVANVAPGRSSAFGMDGTDVWEYGALWNQQSGAAGPPAPLGFQIAATGLSLSSLELTSGGNLFPADISNGTPGNAGIVDAHAALSVPEPETYAMLVAGLGLTGFMVRRRRPADLS
jgi:hypothetical protein